jgi:cobalt-zinc-cadmium efflux system protein
LPHVVEVHDLHIWAMSTTATALTVHLVMPADSQEPQFLCDVGKHLHEKFGIEHTTLQIDPLEAPHPCRLSSTEAA